MLTQTQEKITELPGKFTVGIFEKDAGRSIDEDLPQNDYTKRLEDAFRRIMDNYGDAPQSTQFKSDIESLRERLINICNYANTASRERYLKGARAEVILANLITKILSEADKIDELKPLKPANTDDGGIVQEDFFEIPGALDETINAKDDGFTVLAQVYLRAFC